MVLFLYYSGYASTFAVWAPLLLERSCEVRGLSPCQSLPVAADDSSSSSSGGSGDLYTESQEDASDQLTVLTVLTGVASLFTCPAAGVFADSIGRKPVICFIVGCLCASCFCVALLPWSKEHHGTSLTILIASQALFSLCGGAMALNAVVFAVAADAGSGLTVAERAQLFGMIEACLWLGLLSGPFIGGWLATHFGTQQAFFWGAGCSAVCLLLVLFGFTETLEPSRRAKPTLMRATPFGALWLLFSEPTSAKLGTICLFSFSAVTGAQTLVPLFLPYVIEGWKTVQTGMIQVMRAYQW